jgi:hypothetical protein
MKKAPGLWYGLFEARESRRRSWTCPNWEFSMEAKAEGLFHDDPRSGCFADAYEMKWRFLWGLNVCKGIVQAARLVNIAA